MSGLVGAFMRNGYPAEREAVSAMAALAPYRARDGEWTLHSGEMCAVRQLTWTTPEDAYDAGSTIDPVTGVALLFDGRIDNRTELASVLGIGLDRLTTLPDSAVVLEAWRRWGSETPARLLGDFAWVVWDPLRKRVFCARDPMGIRPLFYHLSDRVFVFASEIRQVLAHPLVPREVDESTVAAFLQSSLRTDDPTLFRHVKRLPHAQWLEITPDRVARRRYWSVDLSRELHLRSDMEYADAFREVFDRAVTARVRSDRAIGAYLSGGLDSSSVLVTACLTPARAGAVAFSLVFPDDPAADERVYAETVARDCAVPLVPLRPPRLRPEKMLAEAAETAELPLAPNDLAGVAILRAMADRGIRVALTGCGGDYGLTGSFFHFAELLSRGRLFAAIARGRDALSHPAIGVADLKLVHHAVWPLLPASARRLLRPLARRIDRRPHAPWIPAPFARRAGLLEPLPPREVDTSQLARVHAMDAYESAWNHVLDDTYHRVSASWGVEERHPFFDRHMIEFALALPDDQRWKRGWMKYVLRGAMRGRLPEAVRLRPDASKADFSSLFGEALAAIGREKFFESLRIAEAGWVDADVLRRMYQHMRRQRLAADPSYGDTARELWIAASLELWYGATFAGQQPGSTTWKTIPLAHRRVQPLAPPPASHTGVPC